MTWATATHTNIYCITASSIVVWLFTAILETGNSFSHKLGQGKIEGQIEAKKFAKVQGGTNWSTVELPSYSICTYSKTIPHWNRMAWKKIDKVSLMRRHTETCFKEGFSLTLAFVIFSLPFWFTWLKSNKWSSEVEFFMGRVAQGQSKKWTESTKVNWKCRKHVALLAFPACHKDGTCAALKHADAKGISQVSPVKQFQQLSFFISFDFY